MSLQAQNPSSAHQGHPSPPTVTSTQHYASMNSPIKVPVVSSSTGGPDSTFTVPDDVGMGFEGGVRVLQSLGNWWVLDYIPTVQRTVMSVLNKLFHQVTRSDEHHPKAKSNTVHGAVCRGRVHAPRNEAESPADGRSEETPSHQTY